jgi:hypothetical protein
MLDKVNSQSFGIEQYQSFEDKCNGPKFDCAFVGITRDLKIDYSCEKGDLSAYIKTVDKKPLSIKEVKEVISQLSTNENLLNDVKNFTDEDAIELQIDKYHVIIATQDAVLKYMNKRG